MKHYTFLLLILIIGCSTDDTNEPQTQFDTINPALGSYDEVSFSNDLILISPMRTDSTVLMNRYGNIVKKWNSGEGTVLMAYLREDGAVVRSNFSDLEHTIDIPGRTDNIEIIDKDNNVIWKWGVSNPLLALHHDIALLPNGNFLVSVWEVKNRDECIQNGKNPSKLFDDRLIIDKILEIEPLGNNEANIVWEWSMWDHVVQDFDSSKLNFGNVLNHPEKIDINIGVGGQNFSHVNSLYYIPEFDQIVVNSRLLNEFFIIDHSTTTQEASTGTGGRYGKGGDLLARYGAPSNIRRAGLANLSAQHDATYIDRENSPGNFLVFDNGAGAALSAIKVIDLDVNSDGFYSNSNFTQQDPSWVYSSNDIFSRLTSGVQKLDNGHYFITSNGSEIMREIDQTGEIIWEYDIQLETEGFSRIYSSGFKARVYPRSYLGIENLNLE